MATTNFNNLSLLLSRKIYDPVAAVDTDGSEVTSALRTDYLNRANRFIQASVWSVGRHAVECYAPGLIKTQAITLWASAGFALPTDFSYRISCQKDGTPPVILTWVDPSSKIMLDANLNPNIQDAYTILSGKTYGYENGTILSAGAGTLYYVQSDQVTVVTGGGGTDIALDAVWWDVLVDIAASFHFQDKGEMDFSQANIARWLMVLNFIRSDPYGKSQ